ncbi:MAG: hypothetical protein M3273_01785 [Actinomycetota bacterium]|nr:hypothetical protein [Actinomycetota bacterium]
MNAPKLRELFVEDLAGIHGGTPAAQGPYTTMACCEEGPFGCCSTLDPVREIVEDLLRP